MSHVAASAGTPLPESGWELRLGRGSRDRPALEVHTGDGLIDIVVAGGLDAALLRGAVRGTAGGRAWSAAWGRLPPGEEVLVEFRSGRLPFRRRRTRRVPAITLAGSFWAAEAPGRYRSVLVTTATGRVAFRVRRYRQGRLSGR